MKLKIKNKFKKNNNKKNTNFIIIYKLKLFIYLSIYN